MGEDDETMYISAYADDITILHWGATSEEVEAKQQATWKRLQEYFCKIDLELSATKSKCL